ncbi:hypothetical protein [Caballeronia sp. dw_276]|jgi:DNA-binding IscR family transcriptional regulator|uniref:hypothetical protein n=1 Tax=Caballeronia sp. dw_276 TaxID=2719795 RepID=UPI001BD47204|nr:hypothetical protein [Caballeronia sp. dw_276]
MVKTGARRLWFLLNASDTAACWVLAKALDEMTLLDMYRAIGGPPVFTLGLADDHPKFLVEQAVSGRLSKACSTRNHTAETVWRSDGCIDRRTF